MRLAFALPLLFAACPVVAQLANDQAPGAPATAQRPTVRPPLRADTRGGQTARSAYGYRLTAPEDDDDGTDRRVLRRLNTRINNRLETRIERYRSIDTRSERTGVTSRNPYEPRPAAGSAKTQPLLRRRPADDPR